MCFSSDSTITVKPSQLIAGAEKPLPSFWHVYSSPKGASLQPSLLPLSTLHTKDPSSILFSTCFEAGVPATFQGSPMTAVRLSWGSLNKPLEHSQSELNISPRVQSSSREGGHTAGYYINQKEDQRQQLSKASSLDWPPPVLLSWARRGRLDWHPNFPFCERNCLSFPTCGLKLVWRSHVFTKGHSHPGCHQSPNSAIGEMPTCQ